VAVFALVIFCSVSSLFPALCPEALSLSCEGIKIFHSTFLHLPYVSKNKKRKVFLINFLFHALQKRGDIVVIISYLCFYYYYFKKKNVLIVM
jgi:hypothetical protein